MWPQLRAMKPNVMLPPSGAASPSTWAERERDSPKKRLHNQQHNGLNAPDYIARAWAHYNIFRGAPFQQIMPQSEC